MLDPNANRRSALRERRLKGVARWERRVRLGKEGFSPLGIQNLRVGCGIMSFGSEHVFEFKSKLGEG